MADDYIWLGGRPVAIVRGNLTSAWAHQADNTGTCTRNGDPANCRIYFPVTDVIGKAVLMLNAAGHVAGTGEYDPFGHVNRVFIDAETAHPYNTADASAFADVTQAVGSGMKVDMRVFVDSLDLDGVSASDGCPAASGSGDALRILDGSSSSVLATLSQPGGLLASAWVAPTAGRVKLALSGPGHCQSNPGCPPCDPITGICPDCPPGTCTMTCDGVSTTTTATGVVAGSYEFRRYETGQAPFWTPLRFPGQYYDAESDLFENWNRYFTPSFGYLSIDPVLVARKPSGDAPGYLYATNNPVSSVDLSGQYSLRGTCPNWEGAVEIARKKAGCEQECNDSECQKKLPCNICQFLNNIAWPPAFPQGVPCSSPLDSLVGVPNGCAMHNQEEGYWIEFLGRACTGASNIDFLAQIIFHESLHMCRSVGAKGFGTLDIPFTDNAETVTQICWRK